MQEILILAGIGMLAGVVSGLVGVGGGIVIVPALILALGYSQLMAQGTSLAMMIPPVGIFAVMTYYKNGHVDLRVAAILAAGFIIGSLFGGKIAVSLDEGVMKKVYAVFLILVAGKMLFFK